MQKKVLLAAVLALFVWGGAFAQEAEAPAVESSNSGGKRPPMYIGVEMGYSSMDSFSVNFDLGEELGSSVSGHLGGFEIIPSFGIAPFSKLPDLALEFNLLMDFMKWEEKSPDPEDAEKTITNTFKITVISPELLAVYTFCEGPVRPFLGAGFGVNINSAKYSSGELSLEAKLGASFALVTKAGVVARIPNTKFDLVFLARNNVNISKKLTVSGVTVDGLRMNLSTLSFALGARFNF